MKCSNYKAAAPVQQDLGNTLVSRDSISAHNLNCTAENFAINQHQLKIETL